MVRSRDDVEPAARAPRRALPGPPVKLKTPPARLRPYLAILWFACLALAVFAQAGATWRLYVFQTVTNPAFASVGIRIASADARDWQADARPAAAQLGRVRARDLVSAIDGQALPADVTAEQVARLIARRGEGQPVTIGLRAYDRASGQTGPLREAPRVRSSAEQTRIYDWQNRRFNIATQIVDVTLAMFLIVVAALLRWRKPKNPVAMLLSFALLFLATLGCQRLWEWLRVETLAPYLDIVWLSLLLIALPALPSGRYVPAWSRWFLVLGPAAALLVVHSMLNRSDPDEPELAEILLAGAIAVAVIFSVILRFLETPRGPERQQMKWAALGFGLGVLLAWFGAEIAAELPGELSGARRYVSFFLTRLGYVLMPLGLLFSMLEYRLNDADAAISRSAAYLGVTTLVGVLWALGTHYSNKWIGTLAGSNGTGIAIALSSILALAVFTPAKTRLQSWTEARFQGPLLRLRALPAKITLWRADDDPNAVAGRALAAIVECVEATTAALVGDADTDHREMLALHGTSADEVAAALATSRPRRKKVDPFPLRLQARNPSGTSLTLMVGPRSDGAYYSKQERAALSAIAEPLADALYAVARRATYNAALTTALADIRASLSQIQAGKRRRKPPKQRAPSR